MEIDLAGERWYPDTVAVIADAVDDSFEQLSGVFDSLGEFFEWIFETPAEPEIDVRNRLRSHT